LEGTVIKSTGSWYTVAEDGTGHIHRARLRGRFKLSEAGKRITNPLAVGDRVRFETEQQAEDAAAIVEIYPRINYLIRRSVHSAGQSHLIATNLDKILLLATLALPRTSLGFIDRILVSAEAYRIPCTIVFNKTDLYGPEGFDILAELEQLYSALGYPVLTASVRTLTGLEAVKTELDSCQTLVTGHSGVGKSTLINALAPGFNLRVGEVSEFAQKGKHTTTFAERFELWPGTYIIDTPGIKELGLAEIVPDELPHYFPEMRSLLNQCRFNNCIHVYEPGCAVLAAVEAQTIAESRYMSYLSMREGDDNRR
jgi:ribosome biogenesis GTPase / thiamine phosphate phosphatase